VRFLPELLRHQRRPARHLKEAEDEAEPVDPASQPDLLLERCRLLQEPRLRRRLKEEGEEASRARDPRLLRQAPQPARLHHSNEAEAGVNRARNPDSRRRDRRPVRLRRLFKVKSGESQGRAGRRRPPQLHMERLPAKLAQLQELQSERSLQANKKGGLSAALKDRLRNSPALGISRSRDDSEVAPTSRPEHLRRPQARDRPKPRVKDSQLMAHMASLVARQGEDLPPSNRASRSQSVERRKRKNLRRRSIPASFLTTNKTRRHPQIAQISADWF
jgi:hypothetical protein